VIDARFGHVNVIARDWHRLADFYTRVFGCTFVPPERDYRGSELAAGTGVPDAALRGVHLRLPGGGPDGPTLEIYQYDPSLEGLPTAANRPGFGHLAFVVPDVATARSVVLAEGGRAVGEAVTLRTADGRRVSWVYVTDPEGNIVELQSWAEAD
jgi:catechol 2,3-dioxygenase-like lactoylglutathione lyase family enzyme